jgi:3-methyl-2-oxobutanoate hydroxymethyltransferase
MQELGCICIVLEAVSFAVGLLVSDEVDIPVIGVGAGLNVDGQALVLQDMLGLITYFKPKFVRTYLHCAKLFSKAINQFIADVNQLTFPQKKNNINNNQNTFYIFYNI